MATIQLYPRNARARAELMGGELSVRTTMDGYSDRESSIASIGVVIGP
jgi:hypothetical protein